MFSIGDYFSGTIAKRSRGEWGEKSGGAIRETGQTVHGSQKCLRYGERNTNFKCWDNITLLTRIAWVKEIWSNSA